MKTGKGVSVFLAALLAAASASVAYADNCGGRYNGFTVSFESVEVVKGHVIGASTSEHAVTSDNSPYTGIGHCVNSFVTTPDGKTRFTYACVEKDKDGDSWSHSGGLEPGADKGTWTQIGGTGKFASKNGSGGWWQGVMAEGKVSTGVWGGNCK